MAKSSPLERSDESTNFTVQLYNLTATLLEVLGVLLASTSAQSKFEHDLGFPVLMSSLELLAFFSNVLASHVAVVGVALTPLRTRFARLWLTSY